METFNSRTPSQAGWKERQPCRAGNRPARSPGVQRLSRPRAPSPARAARATGAGMKLAAVVMSPRGAEEAEGPPGSPARLV